MAAKTMRSSDDVGHRNNMTIMRLIAAIAVIWGHSFALTEPQGIHDPVAVFFGGQTYSGTIAVQMFFVISGFLVTRSMMTARSLLDFGLARILRIFPALIVCNVLIILTVGLFATDLPFHHYLTDPLVDAYFVQNTFLIQLPSYNLPGAFESFPYQSANGSLWTLPGEVRLYVTLGGLLLFWPLVRVCGVKPRLYFAVGLVAWVAICAFQPLTDFLQRFGSNHPLPGAYFTILAIYKKYSSLGLYFFIGGLFYVLSAWVPLNGWVFLSALVCFCIPYFKPDWTEPAHLLSVPYLSLYLAYGAPYARRLNTFGDFSYGIYIYGWPMQQFAVLIVSPSMSPHLNFLMAVIMAVIAAMLSWLMIEKPALGWRKPILAFVHLKSAQALTLLARRVS